MAQPNNTLKPKPTLIRNTFSFFYEGSVCSKHPTKPKTELCGQSAEPFNIRAVGTYG